MRCLLLLLMSGITFSLFAQQEVSVSFTSPYQGNGWQLNGTLTIPAGQGPFPVAILIHGSGPADRDQTIIPTAADSCAFPGLAGDTIHIFKELAEELSHVGVASLRYDKITYTYGNQIDPFQISPYDFINDAAAAIDLVKTRPEVDSNCIILMGHSQGANFLPILAQQKTGISALVSLAGAAKPIDTILIEQIFYTYDSCQGNPSQAITVANSNRNAFNAVRNGTWPAGTLLGGTGVNFWRDWINITDSAIINYQAVSTPTLILQGAEDVQVTAENAQIYEDSLTRDSVDVIILPGMSHNFTFGTQPELSALMYDALFVWMGGQQCPQPTGIYDGAINHELSCYQVSGTRSLNITTSKTASIKLSLVGVDGRVWHEQQLSGSRQYQAELPADISEGIYLVVLDQGNKRAVKRIVVY